MNPLLCDVGSNLIGARIQILNFLFVLFLICILYDKDGLDINYNYYTLTLVVLLIGFFNAVPQEKQVSIIDAAFDFLNL